MGERAASRELDAEVAEKVMGWTVDGDIVGIPQVVAHFGKGYPVGPPPMTSSRTRHCPRFSTDIAAAWPVVEKYTDGDWRMKMHFSADRNWHVDISLFVTPPDHGYIPEPVANAFAPTLPLAICLAALAAVVPDNQSTVNEAREQHQIPERTPSGAQGQRAKNSSRPLEDKTP